MRSAQAMAAHAMAPKGFFSTEGGNLAPCLITRAFSASFGGACLALLIFSPAAWADTQPGLGLLRLGETPLGMPLGSKQSSAADCEGVFMARSPEQQLRAYPGRSLSQALLISQAERALKRVISQQEADILEEAHLIGQEEAGKDSSPAQRGHYTASQLREKVRILKQAFPSQQERGRLVRAGVAGESGGPEGAKPPASEENAKPSAGAGQKREPHLDSMDEAAIAEDKRLLALSEEAMNRLSSYQRAFLGQPIFQLKNSFFSWKKRSQMEELREFLGIDSQQPVAALMSQMALKEAAGELEETEPARFFKQLLAKKGIETAPLSLEHIEALGLSFARKDRSGPTIFNFKRQR